MNWLHSTLQLSNNMEIRWNSTGTIGDNAFHIRSENATWTCFNVLYKGLICKNRYLCFSEFSKNDFFLQASCNISETNA